MTYKQVLINPFRNININWQSSINTGSGFLVNVMPIIQCFLYRIKYYYSTGSSATEGNS